MKIGLLKLLPAIAVSLVFGTASADVTVNADTTTDTAQGLEFLHVGQTSAMDATTAQAGITYDSRSWRLATVNEAIKLIENISGDAIPEWDGSNFGDFDLSSVSAQAMMDALDGGTTEIPGFWLDGEAFGISQMYAHTLSFNDFHVQPGPQWGSSKPGLFVIETNGNVTYTVGGTVSGLNGSVTLTNNGVDDLVINADGAFEFATALDDASNYLVAVSVQPVGQNCSVTNEDGTISGADVTDVTVVCADLPPPPPPMAVPVDSNWALILLTLSLMLIGGLMLRRDL